MKLILTSLTVTASCLACFLEISLAESGVVQHRDGTSGRLSHLGDDIGIYSDPHGDHTIVTRPGTESPIGLRPHGETEGGNRSSFGTPLPPGNPTSPTQLTPVPAIPFHPNRPLSLAPSPNNPTPPGGSGRLGR